MSASPKATILMPTFNHGGTITYAVKSLLEQTVSDFELFIIGDGVPESSKPLLYELQRSDSRIRFLDFPKHQRRGEPNRHLVLQEASGDIVCYMCDRDLWLPNHIEKMLELLSEAEFAHSLSLHVLPGGELRFFPADLALGEHRDLMLQRFNRVPFSCSAHTLEMYRRLPEGWTTTPGELATDWYMFKKFLRREDCRAASGTFPSALTFPSPPRIDWPEERRMQELAEWSEYVTDESHRDRLVLKILQEAITARDSYTAEWIRKGAGMAGALDDIYNSRLWRFRQFLVGIPGLRTLLRKY